MFSDSDVTHSGFSSNWNVSRISKDSCVQTTEINRDDQNTQTVNLQAVGVQTEDDELRITEPKYDEAKLAAFLVRVCPKVVKELDRVSRSNAFASYNLANDVEEEVREVFTIAPSVEGVKASEVSWSCTGSVLAVALSHTLHTSWCSHQGHVALYNIDRENKAPSCTLDANSCIRTVSMHPYISSIVAAGTFSGDVLVWDIARECTLANVSNTSHSDSVTKVRWALGSGSQVTLASSALDGHIILWKVSPQLSSYQLLERYTCDPPSSDAGITSFAFPPHNQDVFVVCLEGGALLHCSTTVAKLAASVGNSGSVKDPVVSHFEPQPATATCVEFSPHHDDVFATAGTDQAIRIYSLFQRCAQRVIWADSIVGVSWSPVQAHVLATWGHSNHVNVYNSSTADLLVSLAPDSNKHKANLSCLSFNYKSSRLLAVGDLDGCVSVWEISLHVTTKPVMGDTT